MRGPAGAAALVPALLLGLLVFLLSLVWDTADGLLRLLQNRKKGRGGRPAGKPEGRGRAKCRSM